jgi:hypothetical protein
MRAQLDGVLQRASKASDKELERLLAEVRANSKRLRADTGATMPAEFYRTVLESPAAQSYPFVYVPRWILRQWFERIEDLFPDLRNLPEHARISIDLRGQLDQSAPSEFKILEVVLYEDMALHFNRARDLVEAVPLAEFTMVNRIRGKDRLASMRAAVASAFYMVEAYANGLAFECVLHNTARLTSKERTLLTEWDADKQRQRFISLKDKLVQYPRILKGVAHPQLTEANCPSLAFIVAEAKQLRDAVVHANPMFDVATDIPERELAFLGMEMRHCEEVVDNAIALLRALESSIRGNLERLWWLQLRTDDGKFPDKALY